MLDRNRILAEGVSWTALLIIVTAMFIVTAVNKGIIGLDGNVGVLDHGDLWSRLDPVSHICYWLGDMFCHQQVARSIVIGGSQMPLCVRETMILVGATIGFGAVILRRVGYCKRLLILSVVVSAITIIEWIVKALSGIDILPLTAITALVSGIGMGVLAHELLQFVLDRIDQHFLEQRTSGR